MIKKYVKKPVIIEAVQYIKSNPRAALDFLGNAGEDTPDGIVIHTLEGNMLASPNDYIIKGVHGEFYPCKPDIFLETYDEVEGESILSL